MEQTMVPNAGAVAIVASSSRSNARDAGLLLFADLRDTSVVLRLERLGRYAVEHVGVARRERLVP